MGDRIVVTGGTGFLGSYVVEKLNALGHSVNTPRSAKYDLRRRKDVYRMYEDFEPEAVIHLAAVVGGIGFNQQAPAKLMYDNLVMGAEIVDASVARVRKLVLVGTTCSYPSHPPIPFREEDIWDGFPEETNAGYGVAKKSIMLLGQLYRKQYGTNIISIIPTNLYGERDHFEPGVSHAIPALIKKCVDARDAKAESITIWGTGSATRDFLYAGDAADAIVTAYEKYEGEEPVNVGSGQEISIRDLVELVKQATGFEGKTVYDPSRPDGQSRRLLDVTRAKDAFGFEAKISFKDGLRRTVDWYENTRRTV